MRDILTILAGLLILVLVAVLAVPPLVDWPAHRALVDGAIARAVGQEVRTAGALDIRLLPVPRIRIHRLRIGSDGPGDATLDASYVKAEIALTPLLAGEVRFLDTRIGRAEFKLPTGARGDWRVPRRLFSGVEERRAWAFENLAVQQFLLTTFDPESGRTDQAYAEGVRIQATSLAGPWRLEGTSEAIPFELTLGEVAADASAPLKLRGGGGTLPRFDVDGRLELVPGAADALIPRFAGTGRITSPSSPPPVPGTPRLAVQAQAVLKAAGRMVEFDNVTVEAGEGAAAFRASGTGSYRVDEPRLTLALGGRRFDLAAFGATYGTAPATGFTEWRLGSAALPLDLSLRLDSVAVGGDEELQKLALRAVAEGDRVTIPNLETAGPGRSTLQASGEFTLGLAPSGSGSVAIRAEDSNRFGRFLSGLGLGALTALLDGPALQASADVTLADPVLSLRNLRLSLGETTISGTVRHSAAEVGGRARIDGQLALSGLDVAALPDGALVFDAARDLDLGLTLDARNVAYGTARGGHISGRIATEGSSILVEGLDVRGLAGAEAQLSGRISPDGSGRIEGRLKAPHAAPLVDLFGRAWLGGLVRLLPEAVRDGAVDLGVAAERAILAGSPTPALRTRLDGRMAGGPFAAETLSAGGLVREIRVRASADRDESWFGRPKSEGPARRASLDLSGRRADDGRLALALTGDVAGLRLASAEPVRLGPDDDTIEAGSGEVSADDASRFLALLGLSVRSSVPLALRATLAGTGPPRVTLRGRVAGETLEAELSGTSLAEIGGRATMSRLSLPWLASALALNLPSPGPSSGILWSGTRFGPSAELPVGGALAIEAATLEGPGGLIGRNARFQLATRPDGVALSGIDLVFAGGRLRGGFTLGRQGGLASLIGEGAAEGIAIGELLGPPFGPGRLSATLRFGASGESAAGLVSNLGGAGEVDLDGLRIDGADPAALERVASRVLRTDDPLASARWQALLAQELGRAPLAPRRVRANASLIGGAIRITPLLLVSPAGSWQGSAVIDLRNLTLEARGNLQSEALPRNWVGGPPAITLGWTGPLARPARTIDPGPLVNGLAAVVLTRELDRVETFELDAAERQRRNSRTEMERQRRLAAEEAARQVRLREEAEERARQEQERQRQEAERQRLQAERQRQEQDRLDPERRAPPPIDVRPPPRPAAGGG
ncbi:AsmA-like C-terminal region-containing protein [uncultured Enterovirga sp.]|uniref:AsmA family protein n=1 Tax=uncultured Enterovirga sp. TaxID=2026352 RepID=UPI0035C9CF43